jgi:hypothetical protein
MRMGLWIYMPNNTRYVRVHLSESNWQQELLSGIIDFQRKLEDAKDRVGNNPEVKKTYQEALDAVSKARECVHRFAGTFNQEYK